MSEALLITGTIGAGKTTVAKAIGELLGARGIPTGVIDLDWLAWVYAVEKPPGELITANLASMWNNLQRAGVERLVMARAVRTEAEVASIRSSIPSASLRIVRVYASAEAIYGRLQGRDDGSELDEHLAQVPVFSAELDRSGIAEQTFRTDDVPPVEVATLICQWLGW